jgi:hypothetical protein
MKQGGGETIARAVGFMQCTASGALRRRETSDAAFAARTLEQRLALVDEHLEQFQHLITHCAAVQNARVDPKTGILYHHFAMHLMQFLDICKRKNLDALERGMHNAGGFCDKGIFEKLSDEAFKQYIAGRSMDKVEMIGSVEILLTTDGDVKRVCYFGTGPQSTASEETALDNLLAPIFPGASDAIKDQGVMAFLKNPTADQEMLATVMAEIRRNNPAMAAKVEQELGLWKTRCAHCNAKGASLVQCSRCKMVRYCNKECQTAHWKTGGHWETCV